MASTIRNFSAEGDASVYGSFGAGQPGFRQDNGQVYVRPRPHLTDFYGPGPRVRTTNLMAHPRMRARRSRGIGMGANNASFQLTNR